MIRLIFNLGFSFKDPTDNTYLESYSKKYFVETDITRLFNIPAISNYRDFLEIIRNETKERLASEYEFQIERNEKTIYLFKRTTKSNAVKFITKYKPESDIMLDFVLKLLRLNTKDSTRIFKSSESYFNLVGPIEVLYVLFSKYAILSKNEELFSSFKLKSKNGKVRDIIAPHEDIKSTLQTLNSFLQSVYDSRNEEIQIAYKKGKNVKTGALKHKDNKYVFNMDLKDFYPSCKRELVSKFTSFLFRYCFNKKFIEQEFLDTILIDDGLFIGSPISGTLANAILSRTIGYLNNLCKKHNVTLTVYADDISFSSDKFISEKFVMGMFNEAFIKYGLDSYFTINNKKSLGYSGCRRKITGVAINDDNEVTIPRKYYRDLRVQLSHLATGDMNINIQKLRGKIAYALMIDDTGKVLRYLKKFESTVRQFSLYSGNL